MRRMLSFSCLSGDAPTTPRPTSSRSSAAALPASGHTRIAPSLVLQRAAATATTTLLYLVALAGLAPFGSDAAAMMPSGSSSSGSSSSGSSSSGSSSSGSSSSGSSSSSSSWCGTKTPSRTHQLLDQARMVGLKERLGASTSTTTRSGRKLLGETCEELPAICDQCVNIPVYLHFLAFHSDFLPHSVPSGGDAREARWRRVTTPVMMLSMVQDNFDLVNAVFQGTPFQFTLMADDYTISVDKNWATFPDDHKVAMSDALRRGGMETLNLYLAKELCSEENFDNGSCVLMEGAFAEFPSSQSSYDGIWMRFDTVTGGGFAPFDLGYTLVHEIGHWLGLYHTFQNSLAAMSEGDADGDPCSESNANDFVDDTGVHVGPSEDFYDCTDFLLPDGNVEPLPDTCPGQELLDPFFNIMNYVSHEVCFEKTEAKFTCGQVERMWLQWNLYRDAVNTCGEDEMAVDIVIQFDDESAYDANSFSLSTVGSSEPFFDTATDFDMECAMYNSQDAVAVDLCVPRGQHYEYTVLLKNANGGGGNTTGHAGEAGGGTVTTTTATTTATATSPATTSILVDGVFRCELRAEDLFSPEAKVLFNSSFLNCNGIPAVPLTSSSSKETTTESPSTVAPPVSRTSTPSSSGAAAVASSSSSSIRMAIGSSLLFLLSIEMLVERR